MQRKIQEILQGRPASDGAGVKLTRVFSGGSKPHRFDPFLMLDEFGSDDASDYIAGFPSHPHRGFETVTYMLQGKMEHQDHLGNIGLLNDGDVQWMTAARGIIHSEMPKQTEGKMRGFQLWINLPAAEKMKDPSYSDISGERIPDIEQDGVYVKLIAGELPLFGTELKGVVHGLSTEPVYVDVHLEENRTFSMPVKDGHTALIYVYEGEVSVPYTERPIRKTELALLSKEGEVKVKANVASRLLILAGKPIGEPIVQYGPFVMNTPQEIDQAIQDYRAGVLTQ